LILGGGSKWHPEGDLRTNVTRLDVTRTLSEISEKSMSDESMIGATCAWKIVSRRG